jgi:hypothetical protein
MEKQCCVDTYSSLPHSLLEKQFIITSMICYWYRLVSVTDTNNGGLTKKFSFFIWFKWYPPDGPISKMACQSTPKTFSVVVIAANTGLPIGNFFDWFPNPTFFRRFANPT